MKYTLADLMPVKADDFIAPVTENLWYWTLNVRTKASHGFAVDNFPFFSNTEWVIPIPGAPEEVRPRKYPDEKPKRKGKYIAHDKINDKWFVNDWRGALPSGDDYFSWREVVDYFINIPLEEEEMEEDIAQTVYNKNGISITLIDDCEIDMTNDKGQDYQGSILITSDELTDISKHWLDLQGYDITKRQPEIAPCPNRECGRSLFMDYREDGKHQAYCVECGYHGPMADTPEEAIRLHNLIAGKGK